MDRDIIGERAIRAIEICQGLLSDALHEETDMTKPPIPTGWRDVLKSYANMPKHKHEPESRMAGWRDGWKACANALAEDFDMMERIAPVGDLTLIASARQLRAAFRTPTTTDNGSELLDAIQLVAKAMDRIDASSRSPLTVIEKEILSLSAHGHTNAEIGRILKKSGSSMVHANTAIRNKLNVRNTVAAVAIALQRGWIVL
jgi:DNA-binding CsgD family transcriptional regulator